MFVGSEFLVPRAASGAAGLEQAWGKGAAFISCCGGSVNVRLLPSMCLCWILRKEACARIITLRWLNISSASSRIKQQMTFRAFILFGICIIGFSKIYIES